MTSRCRFYYEDVHRRHPYYECRLVARNPTSTSWVRSLCRTCPVPQILALNPCSNLALEATVARRLRLFSKIKVYAVCMARIEEIKNPTKCGESCKEFEGAFQKGG